MIKYYFFMFIFSVNIHTVYAVTNFSYEVIHKFDDVIWGFDFLNSNEVILTLRSGDMYRYNLKTSTSVKIAGVPKVHAKGQGGLLDVRVAPWDSKLIFFTYSTPQKNSESSTALAQAEIKNDKLENIQTLIDTLSRSDENIHFGSRIEFDVEKNIYLSIGDRNERKEAQNLAQHNGKVLRINLKGQAAAKNPFLNQPKSSSEVFTYGHRNPQGLALDPLTQKLWLTEMGPRGGDELNLLQSGQNYGWPEATYGREYHGPSIGVNEKKDMTAPVAYWVPSISPSALHFYSGSQFPEWKNNLFIGTLSGSHLRRLVLVNDKVISQTTFLEEKKERFRNIRTGPDGFLYLSTDAGTFARLTPKPKK